jgi:hypothetical protein
MNLLQLREAMTEDLKASLGNSATDVRSHRGQFDSLAEIRNLAVRSPAVLVAIRRYTDVEEHGENYLLTLDCGIYLLTQDKGTGTDRRDSLALIVSQKITQAIFALARQWDFAHELPSRISVTNLTTLEMDKNGGCLWLHNFNLRVEIDALDAATLGIFEGFDADHFSEADPPVREVVMQSTDNYPEIP